MPWCGILSFSVEDITPQSIEAALGAQNIAVRAGLHCAPWVHQWLGTTMRGGAIRVSAGVCNSVENIKSFLQFISHIYFDQ
jgi:selenocysteine lyase/cysteine desulfurase